MADEQPTPTLTEDARRAIFRALVEAQDAGMTPAASRAEVMGQYGDLTEAQVRAVEREGLAGQWPPLGDDLAG